MSRPWVYVAAPYSKGDNVTNVQRAIDAAERLIKLGCVPVVPHLSMLWHMYKPHDYSFWINYDLELLKRCDILLRLDGESSGADNEVTKAREWGKTIWTESYFNSMEAL